MKLIDLQPKWWAEAGRHGQGVSFLCPHCVGLPFHACVRCGAQWKLHLPSSFTAKLPGLMWQLPHGQPRNSCCDNNPEMELKPGLQRLGVAFRNPLDGGAPMRLGFEANWNNVHELRLYDIPPGFLWTRTGVTFEELSLHPSVNCESSGHWHGFIRDGLIA